MSELGFFFFFFFGFYTRPPPLPPEEKEGEGDRATASTIKSEQKGGL